MSMVAGRGKHTPDPGVEVGHLRAHLHFLLRLSGFRAWGFRVQGFGAWGSGFKGLELGVSGFKGFGLGVSGFTVEG